MFREVTSRVNLPQMEENVLSFWREKNIFQKSIDQRHGGPRFLGITAVQIISPPHFGQRNDEGGDGLSPDATVD